MGNGKILTFVIPDDDMIKVIILWKLMSRWYKGEIENRNTRNQLGLYYGHACMKWWEPSHGNGK